MQDLLHTTLQHRALGMGTYEEEERNGSEEPVIRGGIGEKRHGHLGLRDEAGRSGLPIHFKVWAHSLCIGDTATRRLGCQAAGG